MSASSGRSDWLFICVTGHVSPPPPPHLPFLPFLPLLLVSRRMMWRMRRRSRTICLSLALVSIFLHLLLMFVSLSLYHQPCDPPPLTQTPFAKHLANKSYGFMGAAVVAESTDGPQRHSPGVPLDHFQGGRIKAAIVEPLASSLAKLQALFKHPLYNAPTSAVQDEDLLLKVIPKLRSERSSQMWSVDRSWINNNRRAKCTFSD